MEYTTWHTQINRMSNSEYNGTVQVVPFYQKSTNDKAIGNYFGFDWGGTTGILNEIGVSPTDDTILKSPEDVIHNHNLCSRSCSSRQLYEPIYKF